MGLFRKCKTCGRRRPKAILLMGECTNCLQAKRNIKIPNTPIGIFTPVDADQMEQDLETYAGISSTDQELARLHRQIQEMAQATGIKPEVLQKLFTTHKASLPICPRCNVRPSVSYYMKHCKECNNFLITRVQTVCWLCDEIFETTNGILEKNKNRLLCKQCTMDKLHQYRQNPIFFSVYNNIGEEMLFIHFEKYTLKIPSPTGFDRDVDFVSLSFSSTDYQCAILNDGFEKLNAMTAIIKQIPGADREQEKLSNGTWIWTIPAKQFELFRQMWIALKYTKDTMFKEHPYPKLRAFNLYGLSYGEKPKVPGQIDSIEEAAQYAEKAEDFFYNNASVVGTGEMPLEQIKKQLEVLLDSVIVLDQISPIELKKIYRKAAMRYHPDRNNGDGTKMSELNFLFQSYIKIAGVQV